MTINKSANKPHFADLSTADPPVNFKKIKTKCENIITQGIIILLLIMNKNTYQTPFDLTRME